jgi:hypothetical protein
MCVTSTAKTYGRAIVWFPALVVADSPMGLVSRADQDGRMPFWRGDSPAGGHTCRASADRYVMTTPVPPGEEDSGAAVTPCQWIDVTNDDIRAAKRVWWAALEGDAPAARVECLWQDVVRLFRAQAQQTGETFRAPEE